MIAYTKMGGRRVELYVPFSHAGRRVKAITLAPLTLDHVLRWQQGEFTSGMELLFELAGSESLVRSVRYPDTDRMMAAYLDLLTPEIRQDVAQNEIPLKKPAPSEETIVEEEIAVTDQPSPPSKETNGTEKLKVRSVALPPTPPRPPDAGPSWPFPEPDEGEGGLLPNVDQSGTGFNLDG